MTTALPRWLDRELYPFEPKRFLTEDGTMRYLDEGVGRPILIVHGTPSWSFEWRAVVRALSREHRVIVPDHLGFGLSDKPARPDVLRPADHARRLRRLIESLDLRDVTLVVHDFGGPIGLGAAIEAHTRIAAIVAMNTWIGALGGDRGVARLSRLVRSPIGKLLYLGFNASPRWIVPAAFKRHPIAREVHRHYLAPFDRWSHRYGPWTLGCELTGSDAFYEDVHRSRTLLAGKPMRVLWGLDDPAFGPAYLERWKRAFPGAAVDALAGVGHLPAEEATEATVAAIREVISSEERCRLSHRASAAARS